MAPSINAAAARLLDKLGISLVDLRQAGCCGAVPFHLDEHEHAKAFARANIDAWWPLVEQGAEAIVFTASGCGTTLVDYGRWLRDDPRYAERAARIAAMSMDLSQVIAAERDALRKLASAGPASRVAFHAPCSLQHGLKVRGVVEGILVDCGFALTPVPDAHLCCGSAGTYSLLQPELARRLRDDKVRALEGGMPEVIATANIGCLAHIGSGASRPVRHWVELVDERVPGART
jgi:glycolate oxidase iron-sulfur subunit